MFEQPSTRAAAELIATWEKDLPLVVVLDEDEITAAKSFRNLAHVVVTTPEELEVAAIVWAQSLLVSEQALPVVEARAGLGRREEGGGRVSLHPNEVLLSPIVSEKSYSLIADRKYTFRVHRDAHKTQIRQAVEQLFDVHVTAVNVTKAQPKAKRRGFTRGFRPGYKKAIVQVREGETIPIFEGAQV